MGVSYVTKHCLFCGEKEDLEKLYDKSFADDDLTPAVFSARRVTEHFHYEMARCRQCGLVFSRETLSDKDLLDLYSESTVTFGDQVGVLRKDYWRPLRRYGEQLKRGTALEIGCSSGFFLDELKARGMDEVVGFEPSQDAKAKASETVRDAIQTRYFEGRQSVGDARFDLVCSFQTLDHLPEPLRFLQTCRDVMRPGSLVYIVTHDVDSLQARLLGEKSPIIDVEHIYLFNRRTLPRVLEAAGFHVLESGAFRNSYPLSYWAKMFPMKPVMKRVVSGALDATGIGRLAPPVRAGNIYAIAELP